jgi:hypothetical protein
MSSESDATGRRVKATQQRRLSSTAIEEQLYPENILKWKLESWF